jgi:outer membrane lipoprotein SlyB
MASDRVYRVTLRMDDGSTQVVTQETTPDFRSGDRVNHSGGAIQR